MKILNANVVNQVSGGNGEDFKASFSYCAYALDGGRPSVAFVNEITGTKEELFAMIKAGDYPIGHSRA